MASAWVAGVQAGLGSARNTAPNEDTATRRRRSSVWKPWAKPLPESAGCDRSPAFRCFGMPVQEGRRARAQVHRHVPHSRRAGRSPACLRHAEACWIMQPAHLPAPAGAGVVDLGEWALPNASRPVPSRRRIGEETALHLRALWRWIAHQPASGVARTSNLTMSAAALVGQDLATRQTFACLRPRARPDAIRPSGRAPRRASSGPPAEPARALLLSSFR
jgi:hypothetical protein